jgi:hypothetical protein
LPENFWGNVDELATKMADMLLPLWKLMDQYFPESRKKSIRAFYQDLHHIVSEAGFLSIGIRWSHHVFRFNWPVPGQPWELDQEHLDTITLDASTKANQALDEIAEGKWKQARMRLEEGEKAGKAKEEEAASQEIPGRWSSTGLGLVRAGWRAVTAGFNASEQAFSDGVRKWDPSNKIWFPPSYLAKVHIVVLPSLQRYATASGDGKSQDVVHAEGEAVDLVWKSRVVYYLGMADDANDARENEPLLIDWITRRWLRMPFPNLPWRRIVPATIISLIALAFAWRDGPYFLYVIRQLVLLLAWNFFNVVIGLLILLLGCYNWVAERVLYCIWCIAEFISYTSRGGPFRDYDHWSDAPVYVPPGSLPKWVEDALPEGATLSEPPAIVRPMTWSYKIPIPTRLPWARPEV